MQILALKNIENEFKITKIIKEYVVLDSNEEMDAKWMLDGWKNFQLLINSKLRDSLCFHYLKPCYQHLFLEL
jgi:hypothetical protein